MFFTLEKVFELTVTAFAAIDASYWKKCINHMFKEVEYYIKYDTEFQDTSNDQQIMIVDRCIPVSVRIYKDNFILFPFQQ